MPHECYFSWSTKNIFKPHQTVKNRGKKILKNFLRQNKLGLSVRFSPFAYPILGYAIIFVFIDFFCSINSFLFTPIEIKKKWMQPFSKAWLEAFVRI
jgi:hypothetical protein